MTVLSRSKNAAARVTRHDCKWTPQFVTGIARRPHPKGVIHRSAAGLSGVADGRWAGAVPTPAPRVPAARTPAARPLVVSTDEELLDDLLRLGGGGGGARGAAARAAA